MTVYEELFKALKLHEPELQEAIKTHSELQTIPKNSYIIEQGKYIKWLAIVLKGKVRVWQENEDRQILVYYVHPIDTCVLSLSAAFQNSTSIVHAKAEEETILLKIPVRLLSDWNFSYKSWNNFTTATFIDSYDHLLNAYKNLAFHKVDQRILDYLKTSSEENASKDIAISHSQLAKEIGTTREVVSKVLKQLEASGKVKLDFKKIQLLHH